MAVFSEAVGAALGGLKLYEQRASIAEALSRAFKYLRAGNMNLCVFGVGGTGKSTFGALLSGKLDTDVRLSAYQESTNNESYKVAGSQPVKMTAAPGQKARRPGNWDKLYQAIARKESVRIVNIVSYGHHSTMLEKSRHRVYRAGISDDIYRINYFEDGRREEIDAVRELSSHLKAAPGRLKMLTLIAKQDLWWSDRHMVSDYYENGAYEQIINEIRVHRGAATFSHELMSCAFVEENLATADGFSLALTAAGYDDNLRTLNLEMTVNAIDGLLQ